jgi:FeS assembly SUF system regulator
MLRLSKLTDYAMLILSQMAKTPDSILSATWLAETLHLRPPTVSKILKILADASLVTSIRGADGGYRLSRAADEITLADVITAMEGEVAMTECSQNKSLCIINSQCAVRENWKKINKMVQNLLAGFTILDMTEPL